MENLESFDKSAAPEPVSAPASDRLQETWQKAKETARDVRRTAAKSLEEVAEGFDRGIRERPVSATLGALGTGLALGILAGVMLALALKKHDN